MKLTIIFDPLQRAIASGSPFLFLLLFDIKTLLLYDVCCVCVRNSSYTVWCSDEQLFSCLFSSSQQPHKIWYLFCLFQMFYQENANMDVTECKAKKKQPKKIRIYIYIWTQSSIVYVISLRGLSYIYTFMYIYVHAFGVFIQPYEWKRDVTSSYYFSIY
jgi:hypothetical protein